MADTGRTRRPLPPLNLSQTGKGNTIEQDKTKKRRPTKLISSDTPTKKRQTRRASRSPSKERVVLSSPEQKVRGRDNPNLNNSNEAVLKSKERPKIPALSQSEHSHGDMTDASQTVTKRARKKKRVKKISSVTGQMDGLGLNIADIADDIIDPETDQDEEEQRKAKTNMTQPSLKSQPINRLYIEQNRGFRSANKSKIEKEREEELRAKDQVSDSEPIQLSSSAFAIMTNRALSAFTYFCIGILAGLTIWQTVYIYSLTSEGVSGSFISLYSSLSVPVNAAFYILLILSTIAILDRYDVSKVSRPCFIEACTCQSGAIFASLLFLTSLCLNVSMSRTADRLGGFLARNTTNGTPYWSDTAVMESDVLVWKISSIARAALIGIGWFIISLNPAINKLEEHLQDSEERWGSDAETIPVQYSNSPA